MRVPANSTGSIVAELYTPKGAPGAIDPDVPATWTPDVEGVVELEPDINGTSVRIKTLMPPDGDPFHAVTITYEADADTGDGDTEPVMASVTLVVYDPSAREQALTVTLTPSDFVPIPEKPEEEPPPPVKTPPPPVPTHNPAPVHTSTQGSQTHQPAPSHQSHQPPHPTTRAGNSTTKK